jgi:hypothetical protein
MNICAGEDRRRIAQAHNFGKCIHENPLLKTLLVKEETRRLKRNWPIDLI